MLKKIFAAVVGLGLLGTQMTGTAAADYDIQPQMEHYAAKPFLLSSYSTPMLMMVLAKDHKMFYRAYNNLSNLDNDPAIDIGFNPSIPYYGYFDNTACYTYSGNASSGKFIRSGAATPQSIEDAEDARVKAGVPADVAAPAAYGGICNAGKADSGLTQWSGNWLNYAMTSRMDAIRKVLYGGKRSEASDGDTLGTESVPSITVLEHSYVPADAHVWGVEVPADNLWAILMPFSPYYDISRFTPFAKPSSGRGPTTAKLLYFARVSDSDSKASQLVVAPNVPHVYKSGTDYAGTAYDAVPAGSKWRLWDWALGESPIPNNERLHNDNKTSSYRARVQVCDLDKDGESVEPGCRLYSPGNNKPIGVMQKYGDQSDMLFGLITGSYDTTSRAKGGLLRHHINSIDKSIDSNGIIKRDEGSLINTIDKLRITGWSHADGRYTDTYTTFRNPLGEMTYEAVRYFAGKDSPTRAYRAGGSDTARETDLPLPRPSWATGRLPIDCATPIIMAISDVYPEYDSDDMPGSGFNSGFGSTDIDPSKVPTLSYLSSSDFGSFNMSTYLDKVTSLEGIKNKKFFFGQKNNSSGRADCSADTLSSLGDIRGLCPADPAREGSYSVVAAAYYGHTHDFSGQTEERTEQLDRAINFYAVAMNSAFPPLQFEVGAQQITFMPIALSQDSYEKIFLGFINYFITDWQTDAAGNLFEATIIANFEDQLEGSDYERDGLGVYRLTLLTDTPDPNCNIAGAICTTEKISDQGVIINSGVYRGRQGSLYRYKNTLGSAAAKGAKAKIDSDEVVGLLVETDVSGTTAGYSMMFGYTINGTTYDGTYLDAAHSGDNWKNPPWILSGNWTDDGLPKYWDDKNKEQTFKRFSKWVDVKATPWGCLQPEGYIQPGGTKKCSSAYPAYRQARSFKLAETASEATFLPDPLWLAAKYGGFNDLDVDGVRVKNGIPDDGEWEKSSSSSTPANYFLVTNMNELAYQLEAAFEAASRNTSTGTATSASVNSVLGGGLSIQTLYHNSYSDSQGKHITWPGNVYGLFVDRWGNMRENSYTSNEPFSEGQKMLDQATGERSETLAPSGDLIIETVDICSNDNYDVRCMGSSNGGGMTCDDSNIVAEIRRYWDPEGTNDIGDPCKDGQPNYSVVDSIEDLESVWNASQLLAKPTDAQVSTNRVYNDDGEGRLVLSYYPMEQLSQRQRDGWDHNQGPQVLDTEIFRFIPTRNEELAPWLLMVNLNSEWRIRSKSKPDVCSSIKVDIITDSDDPNCFPPAKYPNVTEVRIELEFERGTAAKNNDADMVKVTHYASGNILYITITCMSHINNGGKESFLSAKGLITAINAAKLGITAYMPKEDGSCQGNNWYIDQGFELESVVASDAESARRLINYVLGVDQDNFRSREVASPWESSKTITWRMGDVINSKPIIVGQPANNFDLHYGDPSYWDFKRKWATRRQVAYFGSNGGLLHAINMGFYGSLKAGQAGYMKQPANLEPGQSVPAHELGAELWAYAPTAVLPHLQWLSRTDYDHSYYVDLTPQVVDIRNASRNVGTTGNATRWNLDDWKTVLIGGLRLGGRTILAPHQFYDDESQRYSYSEFFALDVTDPEQPPTILWRFSTPELGLSTSEPAVVSSGGKWYVVIASGPNYDEPDGGGGTTGRPDSVGAKAYDGFSQQNARVFVLDAVTGERVKTLVLGNESDEVKVDESIGPKSFFNSTFTPVAFNEKTMVNYNENKVTWTNPAVYMGLTISREDETGQDHGALYRLQMADEDGKELPVDKWKLARLINTDRPVTGAVNMTSDNNQNIWVVFGTGRLWSSDDATGICESIAGLKDDTPEITAQRLADCVDNHRQYLYGVKEPLNSKGNLTFDEVSDADIRDVSSYTVYADGSTGYLDDGRIKDSGSYYDLSVRLASGEYKGYKRRLDTLGKERFEMIITQPKIEGLSNGESLLAFTTYESSQELCNSEGRSYLHLADSFTGLPAPYMGSLDLIPGTDKGDGSGAISISGYISAGPGLSTEAYIVTTDEGVVVGATGQNSSDHKLSIGGRTVTSGVISWREVLDMGFSMSVEEMEQGLDN